MTESETRPIRVILVPGADARPFAEDHAEAASRGIAVDELALPAIAGHPIDGRLRYFDAVAAEIRHRVTAIRAASPNARVHGIGRNHGGSLLAFAVAGGADLDAMVLTGVIPELSNFRSRGEHASARAFRAALGTPEAVARIGETRVHDMTTSLTRIGPARVLLQVGLRDDWMDPGALAAFAALAERFTVSWLDDDHAMAAPATVGERWDFLAAPA